MKKKLKIGSTAYRVLLLLRHLSSGQCNINRLNTILSEDDYISSNLSNDTIIKYISTLRKAGYDISKPVPANNYNYELNKSPVLMELSDAQIKNIVEIYYYAESMHQNKIKDGYNSFLEKLKKFIPDKQIELLNKEFINRREKPETGFFRHASHEMLIKKIESFKADNQRVSVKYKLSSDQPDNQEEEQIILELKNIKYDRDEVYVSGYNPLNDQTHTIKLGQITEIKQLHSKSQYKKVLSPVIFKLTGKLAKVYRPYESEKIAITAEDSYEITVTAYTEDQETLIKRLLKYGEHCEVIYPKHVKTSVMKIINQSLKNYEEIPAI